METVPILTDKTRAHRGSRAALLRRNKATRFSSPSEDEVRGFLADPQPALRAIEHRSGLARRRLLNAAVQSERLSQQTDGSLGRQLPNRRTLTLKLQLSYR